MNPASQQLLRDREVEESVISQLDHLNDAVVERTVQWFDRQAGRIGVGVLVRELRGGGRRSAGPDLKAEDEFVRSMVARLASAMPEMLVDGRPHPAAFMALARGINRPSSVRRFVRSWIVDHEQQPGAAYETRDAAYWWSVVNPEAQAA